jgi:putative inorganic carbon (HCO3(-)) transporter
MRATLARLLNQAALWGLMALLATLPFWRHRVLVHRAGDPVFFEFQDVTLYTNDLLWWGALGAWALSRLLQPAPRAPLRLSPWFITAPLAGFLALSVAGIPAAVDPTYAAYQSLRLLLLLGLYLLLLNIPLAPGTVAWPLAVGLVLQAAVAIPQFLLGRSLGLARLGEVSVQAAWPGASVVMAGEGRWLRAYGLAQHPNLLAGCLMAMLLAVAGYYLLQRDWRRVPLLVALVLGLAALLLTFSRAAWLGTLVGALLMALLVAWASRQGRPVPARSTVVPLAAMLGLLAVGFVALNWSLLQPRLGLTSQGTEIRSVDDRLMQVPAAWTLIQMRPVLGVGLGNYPTALYRLAPEAVAEYPEYQPVYSVPLLVTAELGPLGGVLWLGLIAAPWLALWLRRREVRLTAWWAGLSGALAALAVASFLDFYVWSSHQGRLVWWLILGLWAREWLRSTGRLPEFSTNLRVATSEVWKQV